VSGVPVPRVWVNRSGKVRLSASPCSVPLADGADGADDGADGAVGGILKSRELRSIGLPNRRFLLDGGTIPESYEAMETDGLVWLDIVDVELSF
jgi:hypothetical protein